MNKRNPLIAYGILFVFSIPIIWVMWFLFCGAFLSPDEAQRVLEPALSSGAEKDSYAIWTLLPTWPTLQPIFQLLLDTPQFFFCLLEHLCASLWANHRAIIGRHTCCLGLFKVSLQRGKIFVYRLYCFDGAAISSFYGAELSDLYAASRFRYPISRDLAGDFLCVPNFYYTQKF